MTDQDMENPAEHIRHATHAAHGEGDRKLTRDTALAVTMMAIMAATIGSLQETESTHALGEKNEAVLLQARASDQWAFFQAKSIKKNAYQIAAEQAAGAGRDPQPFVDKAKHYAEDEDEVQSKAKELEEQSKSQWELSSHHTHRLHTLTLAATLVHVGIAVSSIAIFTNRRLPLYGSLAMAAGGVAVAVWAYLT
jgi:hypothetical protein